jgi:hypothetical protein
MRGRVFEFFMESEEVEFCWYRSLKSSHSCTIKSDRNSLFVILGTDQFPS